MPRFSGTPVEDPKPRFGGTPVAVKPRFNGTPVGEQSAPAPRPLTGMPVNQPLVDPVAPPVTDYAAQSPELAAMYPSGDMSSTKPQKIRRVLSDGSSQVVDGKMYSLADDVKRIPSEVAKGAVYGVDQLGVARGSAMEAAGDYVDAQQRQFKNLFYESPIGQRILKKRREEYLKNNPDAPTSSLKATQETAGQRYSEFGKDVSSDWQEKANTGWEKHDPEMMQGDFSENPSVARVFRGAADSAAPMLGAMALSASGSPGAGAALLASSEALPMYTEAKNNGLSEKDAFSFALLSGIGTAALEKLGLDAVMGKNPAIQALIDKMGKNWVAGALVNFAAEGTQESVQEIWQNAVAMGYDVDDREIFDGALEAGLSGGLMGGGAATARTFVSNYLNKQTERAEAVTPQEGLTPQQIDQLAREGMRPENAQVQVERVPQPGMTTPEGRPVTVEQPVKVDDNGNPISQAEQPAPKPPQETAVPSPTAETAPVGEVVQPPIEVKENAQNDTQPDVTRNEESPQPLSEQAETQTDEKKPAEAPSNEVVAPVQDSSKDSEIVVFHGDKNQEGNENYKPFDKPKLPFFTALSENDAKWYGKPREFRARPKKQATDKDLIRVAESLGLTKDGDFWPAISEATNGEYEGYNDNDLVYIPEVAEALKAEGFDSARVYDQLESSEIDTLIVLDESILTEPLSSPTPPAKPEIDRPTKQAAPTREGELTEKKEPWQMKRENFDGNHGLYIARDNGKDVVAKSAADGGAANFMEHERSILVAIQEGKTVPAEVLADYPDLLAKQSASNATPTTYPTIKAAREATGALRKDIVGERGKWTVREKKATTEIITPSEDTYIGKNAAGERLYDRANGLRYRMRHDRPTSRPNGYPSHGGDLSLASTPSQKPKPIDTPTKKEAPKDLNSKNITADYIKAFNIKTKGKFIESDAKTWDEAGRPTFKGSPEYKAWSNNKEAARWRKKASRETDKNVIADYEDTATLWEAKASAILDKSAKTRQKVQRNEEARLRKSNAGRDSTNVEAKADSGGVDAEKVQKEPSEAQKRVREEFARKNKPVDERLAAFRKEHPFVRAPEAGNLEKGINRDPLYTDLMGLSAKEGGVIPRSNFRRGYKYPKWDQLLRYAIEEIPHIITEEDTGPQALAKIYGFKLETIGDQESEVNELLLGEEKEYILTGMLDDIKDGNLPPFAEQNQYPDLFKKALEISGVDPETLDPVDYPDSFYDELAEIASDYDAHLETLKADKPAETTAEWEKRMGIKHGPEQGEMFGKGAVGDVFELRPETVKKTETTTEKEARTEKENQAEKDQGDIFKQPSKLTKKQEALYAELQEMDDAQVNEQAKERGIKLFDKGKRKRRDQVEEEILQHKDDAQKSVSKMNLKELRSRADELGVPFEKVTSLEALRKKVRQADKGGFIDVSTATRKEGKGEHPFIKQQRDNDKRVHAWHKQQTKAFASKIKAEVVDRQGDVKRALEQNGGEEAVKRLVLRQGSSAEAARQFRIAEKKMNKVLPKKNRTLLKDYIAAMRVVEATKVQADKDIELKSPVEAEAAKAWLNDEFNKLPEAQRDSVMEAAQTYWAVMREQIDALLNEGLITKEAHAAITENHKFYSPRRFVDFIDPVTSSPKGERTHDSGVKALGEGSESALAQDPMYLMAHVITRTQSRIFQNKANKSLYDLAESGSDMVRKLKRFKTVNKETERVTYRFEPSKRDEGMVKVFIDGIETRMAMDGRLAEEWNGLPPALSMEMGQFLQWASGTKILKALATGANPEFAISNLPRDAFYAWFISGQYSKLLPKALIELGLDYARVTKDAVHKTGAYNEYIKEGGGMDFLTTQGATRKQHVEGGHKFIRQIGDILAWAGETSEIATRLAVRNRAMRNGLDSESATFEARNMLDFSQGGTFTKAADNVIPYLNAAVQGTRGGFRAFKTDPAGSSFKAAQLAAIGYGMAYAIAAFFPDLWDSLSDREKATKWIIPLPWKETDKNGNVRHAYIAIPKDQFQQLFAAVGQSMADGQSGRPWGPQVINSLKSISPVDATTLPPIASASIAYFGNYDTWTQEKVWKGYEDISASKEQSWNTPEIANDVTGIAANMGIEISPERLSTATTKIVPSSNPIGGMLASMYAVMQNDQDNTIGKTTVEKVKDAPGLRRLLRFSQPNNVQTYTAEKASRLNVDTDGMTDLEARRAVKNSATEQADVRQPLNVSLDKFLASGNRTNGQLRIWLRDATDDGDERQRLWQRAKVKYPDIYKGSYKSTTPRRKERPNTARPKRKERPTR